MQSLVTTQAHLNIGIHADHSCSSPLRLKIQILYSNISSLQRLIILRLNIGQWRVKVMFLWLKKDAESLFNKILNFFT